MQNLRENISDRIHQPGLFDGPVIIASSLPICSPAIGSGPIAGEHIMRSHPFGTLFHAAKASSGYHLSFLDPRIPKSPNSGLYLDRFYCQIYFDTYLQAYFLKSVQDDYLAFAYL